MGTRHHSLLMGDLEDTTQLLEAFEEQNNCRISFRMGLERSVGSRGLMIHCEATQAGKEIGEVPSLASVSVRCSALNLKTLAAALTHVLYALDFQLALNEFESAAPKKA